MARDSSNRGVRLPRGEGGKSILMDPMYDWGIAMFETNGSDKEISI
jgi:hypothetical protein